MDSTDRPVPDHEGFKRYIDLTNERENIAAETYDKSLLSLSSLLLGISLTFIQQVVPLNSAQYIPILILGWAFLGASTISIIGSYIHAKFVSAKLKTLAYEYFIVGNDGVNDYSLKQSYRGRVIDSVSGALFIAGVFSLILFVSINVMRGSNMSNQGGTETRGQPASTFSEQQSSPNSSPSSQNTGSQTQDGNKK